MASKWLGLGTVVKVDEDDSGSSLTTCTLVIDATPPKRSRVRIDGTSLSDTLATYEAGIEDFSEFMWTQFWEPGDTQHESIDTLFGAKTKVLFSITYTSTEVDTFEGWVSDMEQQPIVKDGLIQRKVTIQRTGAISRA